MMCCPKIPTSKAVPAAAELPQGLNPPYSPSRLQAAIAPREMPGAGCHQLPGACGAAAAIKEGLHSLIFSFQTTSCWSRGIWQSSADLSLVLGQEGKSVAGCPLWNPHGSSGRRDPITILLQKLSRRDPTARAPRGPSRARAEVDFQEASVSEWFVACLC